jgi:copper chaperone NosL
MKTVAQMSFALITLFMVTSCSKGPQNIDYGNDGCHFCQMTIVDKIHATEIITDKGKVFKFDASECMLNYMHEHKEQPIGSILSNYFESPTEFILAEEAIYLISEKLPSPMGANLSAFKTIETAEKLLKEKGGKLYNWEDLKAHFAK